MEALYAAHVDDVDRWVRRLAGPNADAADLIHDVFVVAMRRWKDFRGDSTPRTWLFGIVQNVVATRRRKERVRRWLLWTHQEDVAVHGAEPELPPAQLERRQRERILYAALDRLPDKYRTPLVLHELEGTSGQDLAEALGIEVGTVWVRLHRARALLRKALSKEGALL